MKIVIPEKNDSKNHNVWEETQIQFVFKYMWFFFVFIISFYLLFFIISKSLIHFISLEQEIKIFKKSHAFEESSLSWLSEKIQKRYKDVPYEIYITNEISESNAFAYLWGKIYLTEALLQEVWTLEALDFIIWHEIGHIENRDVLQTLINRFPLQILLALTWFWEWSYIFEWLIANTHSRHLETKADKYGIDFAYKINQNTQCLLDFLKNSKNTSDIVLEAFSTHPITHLRIEKAQKYMQKMWYTNTESGCTKI